MWKFLANSDSPTTANENLSNKPYFWLGLLSNPAYLLRTFDTRSFILGFFDPVFYSEYSFSPSGYGIPLGMLDSFWMKSTLFHYNVLKTTSENRCSWNSEADDLFLAGLSCTCSLECIWLLFYGAMLGSCHVFSLVSSSRSGVNQVSLRKIFSIAPLCDLRCTRTFQFGGIVPHLINETVENSSSKIHGIEVRHDQWRGWVQNKLTLQEMVSEQGIYLHLSKVTTLEIHIYSPLNLAYKTWTLQPHVWWFLRVMSV